MAIRPAKLRAVLSIKQYDEETYKLIKKISVAMNPNMSYEDVERNFRFRTMFMKQEGTFFKFDYITYAEDIHDTKLRKLETRASNAGLKAYLKDLEEQRKQADGNLVSFFVKKENEN